MIINIASFHVDIDERLYALSPLLRCITTKFASSAHNRDTDFFFRLRSDKHAYIQKIAGAKACHGIPFVQLNTHTTLYWLNQSPTLIDWKRKIMEIYIEPDAERLDAFILKNLKLLLMHVCIRSGWLMLHASGVQNGNRTLVFSGPSEIGKSTMAKRFADLGWKLYNDECIILKKEKEKLFASSTPFCRAELIGTCTQGHGQASALFFLEQAHAHRIMPIKMNQRLRLLAKNSFILPFDDETCIQHMKICTGFSISGSIFRLQSAHKHTVTDFVLSFLENGAYEIHQG